jgi:hypothetical protein
VRTNPKDAWTPPKKKARPQPVRLRARLGLAAVPAGFGAIIVKSGWDDLTSGGAEAVPWAFLVLLGLLGALWCLPPLPATTRGERFRRVIEWILQTVVVTMVIALIAAGLFAPELIADGTSSGRAPETPSEARIFALLGIASFAAVGITVLIEKRRARRRRGSSR